MSTAQGRSERMDRTENARTTFDQAGRRFEPPRIQLDADEPDERTNPNQGGIAFSRSRFSIWDV